MEQKNEWNKKPVEDIKKFNAGTNPSPNAHMSNKTTTNNQQSPWHVVLFQTMYNNSCQLFTITTFSPAHRIKPCVEAVSYAYLNFFLRGISCIMSDNQTHPSASSDTGSDTVQNTYAPLLNLCAEASTAGEPVLCLRCTDILLNCLSNQDSPIQSFRFIRHQ